jgi:hypothetical protein
MNASFCHYEESTAHKESTANCDLHWTGSVASRIVCSKSKIV